MNMDIWEIYFIWLRDEQAFPIFSTKFIQKMGMMRYITDKLEFIGA